MCGDSYRGYKVWGFIYRVQSIESHTEGKVWSLIYRLQSLETRLGGTMYGD